MDIPERLRAASLDRALDIGHAWNLLDEAAEEIERLNGMVGEYAGDIINMRAEIERLRDENARLRLAYTSAVREVVRRHSTEMK